MRKREGKYLKGMFVVDPELLACVREMLEGRDQKVVAVEIRKMLRGIGVDMDLEEVRTVLSEVSG